MIYTYAVKQPERDWYMQTDKDSFVIIRKIYEKYCSTNCLLFPLFLVTTNCDKVSYFFNVSKRVVFERAPSGITSFNMIVELVSSNIITEAVHNELTKFIQRYIYRGKEVERIVETRMRQYNEIKTKTTHIILPDPNSLTQHIKRANIQVYYWVYCMI